MDSQCRFHITKQPVGLHNIDRQIDFSEIQVKRPHLARLLGSKSAYGVMNCA